MALVAALAVLVGGCSEWGEQSAGRGDARRACSLLDRAWDRAVARAEEINESGEELAHPAHVGDDGYDAAEWEMFKSADKFAQNAAQANGDFSRLSGALDDLVKAKGSRGVGAVFMLNEPIGMAFDECYDSGLLSRPG